MLVIDKITSTFKFQNSLYILELPYLQCLTVMYHIIIRKYKKADRDMLVQLSMKYPSSTRALLGMIFEEEKIMSHLDTIRETLNPISKFKITLRNYDKLVKQNWQIK